MLYLKSEDTFATQSPISEKQRDANRANDAHATGPRTQEGKARSHGPFHRHSPPRSRGIKKAQIATGKMAKRTQGTKSAKRTHGRFNPNNTTHLRPTKTHPFLPLSLAMSERCFSGQCTSPAP